MSRLARIVVPGIAHHVTQRGNHRQAVFFDDADRQHYLWLLRGHCSINDLRILAYCLMGNHVHLVVVPERKDSLAKALGRTHHAHALRMQKVRNVTGHLWQNRFYSCPIDEEDLWGVFSYVELNPVRAGLVQFPWDWRWSSAAAHVDEIDESGLLDWQPWTRFYDGDTWKSFLMSNLPDTLLAERLRTATRTGRPLGNAGFVRRLERITGRRLVYQKSGPKNRL